MNINFSFDEKNVQVGFENQFVVKDFTNKTLVKLLMLKGEKGDTANAEWGNITGSITNQTDLSNALNNKADTTDIPTDLNQLSNTTTKFVNETQLQAAITSLGSIFTLKGSVATVNDLPSQNNNIGDVYYVVSESAGYIWIDDDGTLRWEQLGMTVDTSDFLTKSGLLSSTGNSTTNTMHQSAITAALNNKADTTDIPTSTRDLTNDSGFITTETDPVFSASAAAGITSTDITNWDGKQDELVSGTNIKTINNKSLLGSGDISLIDLFYPVGTYYETSNTSFNPNTTWGGTWVEDTNGKVTVAYDTSQTEFDTIGKTGGEKTHTLTINEMPEHTHTLKTGAKTADWAEPNYAISYQYQEASTINSTIGMKSNGGGQPHNNLQPYVVVKRWHRTA